jgi:hypothetical protein
METDTFTQQEVDYQVMISIILSDHYILGVCNTLKEGYRAGVDMIRKWAAAFQKEHPLYEVEPDELLKTIIQWGADKLKVLQQL